MMGEVAVAQKAMGKVPHREMGGFLPPDNLIKESAGVAGGAKTAVDILKRGPSSARRNSLQTAREIAASLVNPECK